MKPSVQEKIDASINRLTSLVTYIAAFGLVVMTITIGWQVFARYVLNASPAWTESFALLLMLYFILLAAAAGVREGFHLGVRIVIDNVSPRVRLALMRTVDVCVASFGVAMIVNGIKLAEFTSSHMIPTLGVTRDLAYWPFPISGALILLFSLERIARGTSNAGRVRPSS